MSMKKLRLLHLKIKNIDRPSVPAEPIQLPNELRWLSWENYPHESLAELFQAMKLVGLELQRSNIVQLWKSKKILDKLTFLNLSHSKKLIRTPDFSHMPNLKELNLYCCTSLEEVHSSLGDLGRLVLLNLGRCRNLVEFPSSIHMEFLEILNFAYCENLKTFPELGGNMDRLLKLPLKDCTAIESLPQSISKLTNLVSIDLSGCENLLDLPDTICMLEKLKEMNLHGCRKLEKLPKNLGRNESLELDVSDSGVDGRTIGKLFVSIKEIAKGSNGTIVLEGVFEGRRPVAVKRLVSSHLHLATKEIDNLIESDQHQNIVRYYGREEDPDFVYLALERCTCSLNDLIEMYSDCSENLSCTDSQPTRAMRELKIRLDKQDFRLWRENRYPSPSLLNLMRENRYPSPSLLNLMRDVVKGLVHLHDLRIIHRDLKPQNVLISIEEKSLCAKLSDMGISKPLVRDKSSLVHPVTGCGSSGWQAPEQLQNVRQTRAVDLFSLGCVLFYCITGGRHPFGHHLKRDSNIADNKVDLSFIEYIPEAVELISRLLAPDAEKRPAASEVLKHPLLWDSDKRLKFLQNTSDMLNDKKADPAVLHDVESTRSEVFGEEWETKLDSVLIADLKAFRGRACGTSA